MNHFAHCVLAQRNTASIIGNLLGDFARGVDVNALPPQIRAGLENHRAVDRFTDRHPLVVEMKQRFSTRRRRFAGIALDLYFDHLLIASWESLESDELAITIAEIYRHFELGHQQMPSPTMQRATRLMVEHDWFGTYGYVEGIAHALDRVAERIRFPNAFDNAIEELQAHHQHFEDGFRVFYPELKAHIVELGLEQPELHRT